jgi:flagellar biogenesis protein FliO
VIHRTLIFIGMALGLATAALAQVPAPTPAQQELQAPMVLDDGKPTQAQAAPAEPSGLRTLGSLLLVLGLVGGGLYLLRKYGMRRLPGSGGGRLKLEETLALGDRRFVSILRADEERYLLAMGPQGVTLISRLREPEPSFEAALQQQVETGRPMPMKELERLIQGEQP